MRVLVATKPGMINNTDLVCLADVSEVEYVECEHISSRQLAELSHDFDCLMLNYDVVEPFEAVFYDLLAGSRLKMISCDITGMSWAFPEEAKRNDIVLCNTPNYCTESVAEHIFAQILLLSRRIHDAYMDIINGDIPKIRKGFNIQGKTIGILGLGNIGTRVAEISLGFGLNVIAWNHNKKEGNIAQVDLETLFVKSDIIVVCLKTVEDTIGFLDDDKLKLCKPTTIIVNQAGEQLINKDDMYKALSEKRISGYAGTFSEKETHELYKLNNVVLQPANAWYSEESLVNLRRIWVDNVIHYINGDLINRVN